MTGDFRRIAVFLSFGLLAIKKGRGQARGGRVRGVVNVCVREPLTACGGHAQTRRRAGEVGS